MLEAESIPDNIAAGNIMSKKNSNDTIGYRIGDLLAFRAVPQKLRHRVPQLLLVSIII